MDSNLLTRGRESHTRPNDLVSCRRDVLIDGSVSVTAAASTPAAESDGSSGRKQAASTTCFMIRETVRTPVDTNPHKLRDNGDIFPTTAQLTSALMCDRHKLRGVKRSSGEEWLKTMTSLAQRHRAACDSQSVPPAASDFMSQLHHHHHHHHQGET
ncbi:unnamed protein product [Pleuronectes platessa]|uniref:Uncharacterized protein n=1 Tax=Pleuronectes platessa TaxID=8262 RepID=A0A9N7TT35_PLEPL|nr:unnamed protein product [Pleuronectes platessa]